MATVIVNKTFLEYAEGGDDDQPAAMRTFTAPGMLMGKQQTGQDEASATHYVDDGTGNWKRASHLETMAEDEEGEETPAAGDRADATGSGGDSAAASPIDETPHFWNKDKRTPKLSRTQSGRAKRTPKGQGSDPWGLGAATQMGAAIPPGTAPLGASAQMGPPPLGGPPMPMPTMPGGGFFPPWPTPNPFMAAFAMNAMNVAAMQMMAASMPTNAGYPGTMAAFVPGAMPGGMPTAAGALPMPAAGMAQGSPSRRGGKKGQQAQQPQHQQQPQQMPFVETGEAQGRTTVMLRNIPNNYTRAMLLELLDQRGLAGRYDFVYLPFDFKTQVGLGFAFVNMLTPSDAEFCRAQISGFRSWSIPSGKVCEVGWSGADQQGLEANVERYRNSSVMHPSVAEELKPVRFVNGVQVPFPKPTRKVWPPHSNYGLRAKRAQGLAQ
mmetsp:Transcript_28161/g.81571  ORF Transcript_28161/g.81571 Transcript_28161/m.81571 type:complete len:437 (+) Transcript_28161:90-1400(+)